MDPLQGAHIQLFVLKMQELDLHDMCFQQDAATRQTAHVIMDLFRAEFSERFILRSGPVNWPSISYNLTPLDYFLCICVKLISIQTSPLQLMH